MAASYPASSKTFTTKSNNTTADASHINDVQAEITAIEDDLIGGLPATRGGTGLTALPADGFAPVSNGSAYVATDVRANNAQAILAAQVFG